MTEIERLREALTPRQAELLAHLREHKTDHPGSWYLFVNGGFKSEDARALHGAGLVDYSEQMGMPALRLRDRDEDSRGALLPCPFCGGAGSFEAVETRWTVGCNETNENSEGCVFEILCYGYQSLTTFATQREAAAAWNRRAALAAAPPGAERWMPIETRSPHDEGACWVGHAPSQRIAIARPAKRLSGIWYTEGNNKMLPWLPTHYMPLPRPPAIPTGAMLAAAPPSPTAGEK